MRESLLGFIVLPPDSSLLGNLRLRDLPETIAIWNDPSLLDDSRTP